MNFAEKALYNAKTDPEFAHPVILEKETREREILGGGPVPYLYVHGKFDGTAVKFLFCIPEREAYEGRFYMHLSPFPGPDEELASLTKTGEDDFIAFALTHGACFTECNMGSVAVFSAGPDSTIYYRSNAAVAEYLRTFLQELYGEHRVYGYVFGGSGGGYKTMSCIENTTAFDGAVPFVIGSPVSLPNCLTVPAYGKRMLRRCWPQIMEAVDAGGSGDPYEQLDEEEKKALLEITRMGFPPRMCWAFGYDDDGALPVLAPTVHEFDEQYFTDFWTVPGYQGAEEGGSARRDRVCVNTTVTATGVTAADGKETEIDDRNGTDTAWQKMLSDGSSAWIEAAEVPEGDDLYLKGIEIFVESGKAAGKKLALGEIRGKKLIPGMSFGADDISEVIGLLEPGDRIRVDNSDYIAIQSYHRHQIPEDRSFYAWDQYRNPGGTPAIPQRGQVISYGFTAGGCGSVQDGKIQGHVIITNSLMDGDFPWQADWYRNKVTEVYGEDAKKIFRIWYNDNAPHGDVEETDQPLRTISYLGMLRQALLDVAHWTEEGTEPAPNTGYEIVDSQVILTDDPKMRGGSQPIAELRINGEESVEIKTGDTVKVTVRAAMSPTAGDFVSCDFSFEEEDFHEVPVQVRRWEEDGVHYAEITAEHTYETQGRHYAVVRVISNRDAADPYTRLRNLARARVDVRIEK